MNSILDYLDFGFWIAAASETRGTSATEFIELRLAGGKAATLRIQNPKSKIQNSEGS